MRIIKNKYIRIIAAMLLALCVWGLAYTQYRKNRIEEISQEFNMTPEEQEENEKLPLPDSISMLPNLEVVPAKNISFGYDKEGRKRAQVYALKIEKRGGVYYWDSNGKKPLTVETKTVHLPTDYSARKVSTFTAGDGSGSIIIKHDGYLFKGSCHYPHSQEAEYVEYRLDKEREFHGVKTFFPPRPDDWCKTLETRLNEEFN